LNRQLVVFSKSGFKHVWIFTSIGETHRMRDLIKQVEHRLYLTYEIIETAEELLGESIATLATKSTAWTLITQADIIIHPTLLKPIVTGNQDTSPVLYTYADVTFTAGRTEFGNQMAPKFRTIFRQADFFRTFKPLHNGVVHCNLQLASVTSSDLATLRSVQSTGAVWDQLESGKHRIQPISEAWWLKVDDALDKFAIDQFFWLIAFKEISGEFSKMVNSKLSKPLSLLFARLQVAPNTISTLQLVLLFVASSFLLWPSAWALIPFALLWQFAAGILDRCDGETARIRNYESEAGAKFDVLVDDLRFIVPFAAITTRLLLGPGDLMFLWSFLVTMAFFLMLTVHEIRFMRRAGYLSRQVMGVDYSHSLTPGSSWARFFGRFRPFFKGDARTFQISVLCFLLNDQLIYWMLLLNLFFMALQGATLIIHLRKKVKAASSHNAELVRT